jgi:pantoate--beta-alanine ligase
VATVVTMLLNMAMPTYAVFGEKDRQQLALVTRMARDLRIRTTIVGRPIVREADGLAMSSRNAYLSQAERENAPVIRAGLDLARNLAAKGEKDAKAVKDAVAGHYREAMPEAGIDYVEIVDGETMQPVAVIAPGSVCAVAVALGKARLIDNAVLVPESP